MLVLRLRAHIGVTLIHSNQVLCSLRAALYLWVFEEPLIRPSEIGKYCRVPARMDLRRIRRGANNEFMNENAIPGKIIE